MKKNLYKKLLALLLAMCLAAGCMPLSAGAEGNALDSATPISFGETVEGAITETQTSVTYRLDLPSSGCLSIKFSGNIQYVSLYLYNKDGNTVWDHLYSWNSTTQQITANPSIHLLSGPYYFCVAKPFNDTGAFSFEPTFTSANETFAEAQGGPGDNSLSLANPLSMGETYTGLIAKNDDKDFYKFSLESSGRLSWQFNGNLEDVTLSIYNADGLTVWEYSYNWNSTTQQISLNLSMDLLAGDYFFCVSKRFSDTGAYTFKMGFTSADESFAESQTNANGTLSNASNIALGVRYRGMLAANESKDFYRFAVSGAGDVVIRVEAAFQYLDLYLYDADGQEVWRDWYLSWNSTTQKITVEETLTLSPGTYYLCFQKDGKTGNYTFSVSNPGSAPADPLPTQFTDVPAGQYYVEPVKWAVENNVTSGLSADQFGPNEICTRAQFVTFLWRASDRPAPTSAKNPFVDVDTREYYGDAVLWAVENGIVYGTSDTAFSPNAKVTRAQAVTFLWRLANKPVASGSNPFVDVPAAEYYRDAVLWGQKNGIVYGTDSTHFNPDGVCVRAQTVTFLHRYCK